MVVTNIIQTKHDIFIVICCMYVCTVYVCMYSICMYVYMYRFYANINKDKQFFCNDLCPNALQK